MNTRSDRASSLLARLKSLPGPISSLESHLLQPMRPGIRSELLNVFLALLLVTVPSGLGGAAAQGRATVTGRSNAALDQAAPGNFLFFEHTIANDFDGVTNVYPVDLDGDGDVDVLGGATMPGRIAWWEPAGSEAVTAHTIAENFLGVGLVQAADIDDDGDLDVLAAAVTASDISWWENDGSEVFTKHTIADNRDNGGAVVAADVDGDGDVDIVAVSDSDTISWWENDGSETFTEYVITGSFDDATLVRATDLDGDGDVDVLGSALVAGDIKWWENDGSETFTEHPIADDFEGVTIVRPVDIDGDGHVDVLGTALMAGEISWWENDGNESFTKHTIADERLNISAVDAADLDDDGSVDIVGVSNPGQISWWENDGSESFTEHLIAASFDGAGFVRAFDLDDDGDVDVLGTARGSGDIHWWEQRGIAENNPPDGPSDPSPADDATDVSTGIELSWTGGDPDSGDTVTYDVYFEAADSDTDVLLCSDVFTPTCDPGRLDYATHYSWYVVATDVFSASTTGSTWSFTTTEASMTFLPLVARRYPPLPDVPVLNGISNVDGDGDYTVTWNPALRADEYVLEEDDNDAFSSPTTRYSGSDTTWDAAGTAPGTYYYRVKASNTWGDSGWSTFRSVTVLPPCVPDPAGESDNVSDALTVCSGQTVSGRVSEGDDLDDVYRILTVAGQLLTISMNGSGGDADLFLYPPGTTNVYTDDWADYSEESDNDEFIQHTLEEGGFWYIDVFSYEGTTDYSVTITLSVP